MAQELWLNFRDENGENRRVLVEGERFGIGRTPDNDLQIPLGSLSREHIRIERFDDVFEVLDCGSSNGTTLNGEKIHNPIALHSGDLLNLGNAVEIEVELVSVSKTNVEKLQEKTYSEDVSNVEKAQETPKKAVSKKAAASSNDSGSNWGFIILAPILGIFLLLIFGGIVFLMGNPQEPEIVLKNDDYTYKSDIDEYEDFPDNGNKKSPEKIDSPTPTPVSNGSTAGDTKVSTPEPVDDSTPIPKTSDDVQKIESSSATFLRNVAQNDPKAFLTGKQIAILNGKINQFKGASVLAENIRNAKKSSSQLATMAKSKNLKPLFLTSAALAKLGNQRGDVVSTAQGILDNLDNLSIVIGNELADDNLLVIAAFDQGLAGENLKLRDMMARLTKEFPSESSRKIRTIWFLKDNNKITDGEFEFALRFLAIGTITQNPKDFNVQAEAITF